MMKSCTLFECGPSPLCPPRVHRTSFTSWVFPGLPVYTQTSKFTPPAWLCDVIKSGMNKLNARWTFKHCISQLARLLKMILTRRVERPVYCKFMVLLFLLAPLYGHRGSACSQDSGSNMGHLRFVVQIGAKWSYNTVVAAWVHYNQQFNILELEE